jgi:predicted adenylyl cyclase CyaB
MFVSKDYMAHLNVEFKARVSDLSIPENKLLELNPFYKGEDKQVDTYFNVPKGRLKLREGNIENALIYYERENMAGKKQSNILLYQHEPNQTLKDILVITHGVKVVVNKSRKIYFIDNVKFHFDVVASLGTFIEVEAIDSTGDIGLDRLTRQCEKYAAFFNIKREDYVALSYSDLLLDKAL